MDIFIDYMLDKEPKNLINSVMDITHSPMVKFWDFDGEMYYEKHSGEDISEIKFDFIIMKPILDNIDSLSEPYFYLKYSTSVLYIEDNDSAIDFKTLVNKINKLTKNRLGDFSDRANKYSKIIEKTIDAVICINSYGIIIDVNNGTEKMFKYTMDELKGSNVKILMPDPHHSNHDGYLKKYRQTKQKNIINTTRSLMAKKKDGTIFHIELSVTEIDSDMFVAIIRDVTKIKAVENARELFIANMSHEIRTPLNGIIGITQIIQSDEQCSDKFKEYLTIIDNCGKQLLSLINDVLDYSKIAAGCMELHPNIFSPTEVIEKCHDTIIGKATDKNVNVSHIFRDIPEYIYTDEQRISQVIINLLSNAIKFTNHGNIITTTEAECIEDDNYMFKVHVKDTGIGIPSDKLDVIFQNFGQVDNTFTKSVDGTGLGLSISVNIAKMMGGELTVKSKLGEGSTFTFSFVAKRVNYSEGDGNNIDISCFNGLSALVIDDNINNRLAMYHLLHSLGINSSSAYTKDEALLLINDDHYKFDLILMDICMPEVNGIELTQMIRTRNATIPIIAVSSIDEMMKYKNIFNDTLLKPIKKSSLILSMYSVLFEPNILNDLKEDDTSDNTNASSSTTIEPNDSNNSNAQDKPVEEIHNEKKEQSIDEKSEKDEPVVNEPVVDEPNTNEPVVDEKNEKDNSVAQDKTPSKVPKKPVANSENSDIGSTNIYDLVKSDSKLDQLYSDKRQFMKFANDFSNKKLSIYGDTHFSKNKVLVVEDNPSNVFIITSFLVRYGYSRDDIQVRENGLDAIIDIIKNQKSQYYIILMDIKMPFMDGHMAMKKIREAYPDKDSPPYMSAISASILGSDKEQCIRNGVDSFIHKPIDVVLLYEWLDKYNPLNK